MRESLWTLQDAAGHYWMTPGHINDHCTTIVHTWNLLNLSVFE